MLAPRGNFYHNIHPCEPLSQYSSRVQLASSPVNPIAQQSPIHRNYYLDTTPTPLVPWATLPRRHNSHDVDTFPTTAKDSPSSTVTNSSNRPADQSQTSLTKSGVSQLTAVQQQSPNLQRQQRQRNVIQPGSPRLIRSPQKLPVKVSPPRSPISFAGYPAVTARGNTASPVVPANNSNSNTSTTTTNVIADISNSRRVNHTTSSGTANTNAAIAVPVQAGFSDAKQVSFSFFFSVALEC